MSEFFAWTSEAKAAILSLPGYWGLDSGKWWPGGGLLTHPLQVSLASKVVLMEYGFVGG